MITENTEGKDSCGKRRSVHLRRRHSVQTKLKARNISIENIMLFLNHEARFRARSW